MINVWSGYHHCRSFPTQRTLWRGTQCVTVLSWKINNRLFKGSSVDVWKARLTNNTINTQKYELILTRTVRTDGQQLPVPWVDLCSCIYESKNASLCQITKLLADCWPMVWLLITQEHHTVVNIIKIATQKHESPHWSELCSFERNWLFP